MDLEKRGLAVLGERIRAAQDADVALHTQWLAQAREQLLQNVGVDRQVGSWRLAWPVLGAGIGAVALACVVFLVFGAPKRPSFVAGGEPGTLGRSISARDSGLSVEFNDGSRVALSTGARARVVELQQPTVRMVLEAGHADVHVVHLAGRAWIFEAGSFEVLVTGTRFGLDYEPKTGAVVVQMLEGEVVVTSSCGKGRQRLRGNQALTLTCEDPPTRAAPQETIAQPVPPDAGVRAGAPPPSEPDWRALAKAGRHAAALAAAERQGFSGLCETLPVADLTQLADAARFAGRPQRARSAFEVLRRRFSGSRSAALASFYLGRLAYDSGAFNEAASSFSTYIREASGGELLGEAYGGLLDARFRSGDVARAKAEARTYLARFPQGPYVGRARRILEN